MVASAEKQKAQIIATAKEGADSYVIIQFILCTKWNFQILGEELG